MSFMPPAQRIEDYLDLISSIEATCEALQMEVIIEGYLPPPDPADRIVQGHARPGRD